MLAFGQACLCAGRLDCRINRFGVSLGRDDRLFDQLCIANRAMLAFGQACLCTGRLDCRINNRSVRIAPSCIIALIAERGGRDARHLSAAGLRSVPPLKLGALLCPVGRQHSTFAVGIRGEVCARAAAPVEGHGVGVWRPARINRMIGRLTDQVEVFDFQSADLIRIPAVERITVTLCQRQAVVVPVAVFPVVHHGKGGGRDGAAVGIQRHGVGVGSPFCIEGMVAGGGHRRAACHLRGEIRRRIPAFKGIASAGGRGQRAVCTVVGHGPTFGIGGARVFYIEGQGVGVRYGGCRDLDRALDTACRYRNLAVPIGILGCGKGAAVHLNGHGRRQAVAGVCLDRRRECRQTRDRRRCSHGAVLPICRDGIDIIVVAVVDTGQRQIVYGLRRIRADLSVPGKEHIALRKGFAAVCIVRQRDGKLHRPGMGVAAGRIDAQLGISRLFPAGIRVEAVRHAALDQLCHKACTRAGVPLIGDGKGEVEGSCRVGGDGQRNRKRHIGKSAKRSACCIRHGDTQLILRGDFRGKVLFIPCRFISIIPRSCYIKLRLYHFLLFGREGIPAGVRNKPVFG